jgi:uncharacterized membrane protein (UPF0182 family)
MRTAAQVAGYVLIALILFGLLALLPLYVDWLWFQDLGYAGIFTTILGSRVFLGVATGFVFFVLVWGSAVYALRSNAGHLELYTMDVNLPIFLDRMVRRGVQFIVLAGAVVVSVLAGLEASTHWESFLTFRNAVPFGQADPVFNIDIGFYVFRLDFVQFLYRTVQLALVAAVVAGAAILYLSRTVDILAGKLRITAVAAGHLGLLLALIAGLQAVGFRLSSYELLFAQDGTLTGPGYTDIKVRLLGLNLAIVASLIGAGLVLLAARRRSLSLAVTGLVLGIAVNFIIGQLGGAVVQRLIVQPDELNKEAPYLARHIKATQEAYGLHNVERREVDFSGTLTPQDLEKNSVTLQSVRLWDYRPLQAAYSQLQDIQQYYKFTEVDIDRYTINGVYRQVMLSPREIDQSALPADAQTWINLRLKYTHGFGIAMSPVNEVTEEGLPRFFVRDIPPVSPVGVKIDRPQIYFGEKTDGYVIVNTRVKEFDYPRGSEGVYTTYEADSGVPVGGYLRKTLLAARFADINIALSGNIRPDSRILFRRNVRERVSTLAPFLRLDSDPYIVISGGRIFWMQDAYTLSGRYPYSRMTWLRRDGGGMLPPIGVNYIRNSVKIVVDAYTGEVSFYAFDEQDPVLKCYSRAFPGMFRPASEMPATLREHVRYPEDLFRLQTIVFQTFHMSDVQQFYNKGDVWAIPTLEQQDDNGGGRAAMEPYYVIMKLPGAAREEFILLMPFSRANKDNMVAWMAARCDAPNYGRLLLYEFPKGEQFFGPAQIQARANQNTEISEQMTLWNQQKSNVYRGNLLVIPIEDALLYIEPIYLQSTNAKIPEFKRVIVALGNEITMQPTLAEALDILVGRRGGPGPRREATGVPLAPAAEERAPAAGRELILRALKAYNESVEAQRRGDWAEYGRRQKELGELLRQAAGRD